MTNRRPAPRPAPTAHQAARKFWTHDVEVAGEQWRRTGVIPTPATNQALPDPQAPQVPGRRRPSGQLRAAAAGRPVVPLATRRARAAKRRARKARQATVNGFAAIGVMVFVLLLLALITKGIALSI